MKVLLINGSPHKEGCTFTALSEVAKSLQENGVETEIFWIGTQPVRGCIACAQCRKTKSGRCAFDDDAANRMIEAINGADGVVVGSPVYFAGVNGALCALLDRAFYASGGTFWGKPAAAVCSCRRGGAGSTFDRLNKYFTMMGMPVVSSQYWNSVHGNKPDEVRQDEEGLQTMRVLGKNMAHVLHELANKPMPAREPLMRTNFIR